MQERRQTVRAGTPILVEFPHPQTAKTERSFTHDVSETGMRFPTTATLRVGQELSLQLELPFHDGVLRATGEVVWIREIARFDTPHYDIGVRFRWIEDPDRQQLNRHLATLFHGKGVL